MSTFNVFILTSLTDTPLFIEKSIASDITKICIEGDFLERNATFRKFVDSHGGNYRYIEDIDDKFRLNGWMLPIEAKDSFVELIGDKVKLNFIDQPCYMMYKAKCLTIHVSDDMICVENIGNLYSYLHDQKFTYSKEDKSMYQEFHAEKYLDQMVSRLEKYLTTVRPTKYEIVRG